MVANASMFGFGLAITLSTVLGILAKLVGQSTLVAYLAAGLLLSVLGEKSHIFLADFSFLPEIGLVFLLFLVGMELDIRRLFKMGRSILSVSVGQMLITTGLGFGVARLIGFLPQESLYLGLGLAFSSTVIVVKMFTDRKEMDSLHGRLALGILLVEDLVAVMMLMGLSLSQSGIELGVTNSWPVVALLLKGILIGLLTLCLARFVLPSLLKYVAHSSELLLLCAIAICFSLVGVFSWVGFSFEIGAFIAGMMIGASDFKLQIAARIKPLRDLFVAIFFVELGVVLGKNIGEMNFWAVLVFSIYAVVAKPLIFVGLLSFFKFRRHTVFQTAVGLSQVSEFSLIVLSIALSRGIVGPSALSLMAFVTIGTMAISSFCIGNSGWIYRKLRGFWRLIPEGSAVVEESNEGLEGHVVLVGCDRTGMGVLEYLKRYKRPVLIVDFNPEIVEELKSRGEKVVFGDIADPDVFEAIRVDKCDVMVSTIRDFEDNLCILDTIKKTRRKVPVIMAANSMAEAKQLEKRGAYKVAVPTRLEGEYVISLLKQMQN